MHENIKVNLINIACILGTRPEVIKMAPVIMALRKEKKYKIDIICTAQHRELTDKMLNIFNLTPNIDLDIMKENQSLASLTGNLFSKLDPIIKNSKYKMIIAQGDTTTTFVAAQIAFFHHIPFAHVEAGLRSHDLHHPFPEEMNRVFTARLAALHFVPTNTEKNNLLKENISEENIFITGNTVIDSLYLLSKKNTPIPFSLPDNKKIILMTLHRRENFGKPLENIFSALAAITEKFTDIVIIYPVHPNPNVKKVAHALLNNNPRIVLTDPLPYDVFVSIMKKSYFILTDSGGLQEEAPALGKPVFILRKKTERHEIIDLNLGKLVGTSTEKIIQETSKLLTNRKYYESMVKNISPYGDGFASEKILEKINGYFSDYFVLNENKI